MDPRQLAAAIAGRPSYNEWDRQPWSEFPDAANAANPPGPRMPGPDLGVLNSLRSRQSFDERAAPPDPTADFQRRLYEKGALQNWQQMNEDMMLTPEQSQKLFPVMPFLPLYKAGAMGSLLGTGGGQSA